jgi:hypothetical protein
MARVISGTLTANTVAPLTITDHNNWVEVVNRSQTGEIWVRTDGTDPTVAGNDCYVVLGARRLHITKADTQSADVRLISNAALAYTVEAVGADE